MNTAEKLNSNGVLLDLINGLVSLPDPAPQSVNIVATGIQMDSRLLQKGDLFLACFGNNHDAREFIDEAIEKGAGAIIYDPLDFKWDAQWKLPRALHCDAGNKWVHDWFG